MKTSLLLLTTASLIGLQTGFAEDGALRAPPNLASHDSLLDPVLKEYVSHGAIVTYSVKTTQKGSTLDGPFLVSDIRGLRLAQGRYKNGELNSDYRTFHPNGVVESIRHYNNGEIEGTERYWDNRGRVTRTTSYAHGKKEGLETYYLGKNKIDLQIKWGKGELSQIALFDDGKKVKLLTGEQAQQFFMQKALKNYTKPDFK